MPTDHRQVVEPSFLSKKAWLLIATTSIGIVTIPQTTLCHDNFAGAVSYSMAWAVSQHFDDLARR
jgi:hypothetical protein